MKIKHTKDCFRKHGANWCSCEAINKLDAILSKFKKPRKKLAKGKADE